MIGILATVMNLLQSFSHEGIAFIPFFDVT